MIRTKSESTAYRCEFTNGNEVSYSDATAIKDGSQAGFRPHELLEAALANCLDLAPRD